MELATMRILRCGTTGGAQARRSAVMKLERRSSACLKDGRLRDEK